MDNEKRIKELTSQAKELKVQFGDSWNAFKEVDRKYGRVLSELSRLKQLPITVKHCPPSGFGKKVRTESEQDVVDQIMKGSFKLTQVQKDKLMKQLRED
jgi:hypothetical protein